MNILLLSGNLVLLISLSLEFLGRISLLQSRAILNYLVSYPSPCKGKRGLTWEKSNTLWPLAFNFGSRIFRNAIFPHPWTSSRCCSFSGREWFSSSGATKYGCWHIFLNYIISKCKFDLRRDLPPWICSENYGHEAALRLLDLLVRSSCRWCPFSKQLLMRKGSDDEYTQSKVMCLVLDASWLNSSGTVINSLAALAIFASSVSMA